MKDDLILWDEKFAIGIPLIDGEHKKLITLCNNLYKIITHGNSFTDDQRHDAMKVALKECVDYAKFHFLHEEELMQFCGFDRQKFIEHKAEHLSFAKRILEEVQAFDSENHVSSYEFVRYLYDWILTHIAHSDKLYVSTLMNYLREHPEFLNSKKLGSTEN